MNHELVLQLMYAYFYFMVYAFGGWSFKGCMSDTNSIAF